MASTCMIPKLRVFFGEAGDVDLQVLRVLHVPFLTSFVRRAKNRVVRQGRTPGARDTLRSPEPLNTSETNTRIKKSNRIKYEDRTREKPANRISDGRDAGRYSGGAGRTICTGLRHRRRIGGESGRSRGCRIARYSRDLRCVMMGKDGDFRDDLASLGRGTHSEFRRGGRADNAIICGSDRIGDR